MTQDESSGRERPGKRIDELSDSENAFGVNITTARTIGMGGAIVGSLIVITLLMKLFTDPTAAGFAMFVVIGLFTAFAAMFGVSEKEAGKFDKYMMELETSYNAGKSDSSDSPRRVVCRECREEVSRNVNRCPHCGWKPKKRGGLWWGTTALMSLNPIGWAMGAKGAKDKIEASKGVWEETDDTPVNEVTEADKDPIEALERLSTLREKDVITAEEFEIKKEELLDDI